MKIPLLIATFFISTLLYGQIDNKNSNPISSKILAGTWVQTHVDSIFGHVTELKFNFSKGNSFTIVYSIDKEITERYFGKYKIENGNILKLIPKNKQSQYFKIIQVSLDFLKLNDIGRNETIQFVRE